MNVNGFGMLSFEMWRFFVTFFLCGLDVNEIVVFLDFVELF